VPELLIRNAIVPRGPWADIAGSVDVLISSARSPSGESAGAPQIVEVRPSTRPSASLGDRGAVEVLDAGGRWLVPGLWDEHVHASTWASSLRRIDLSAARSAAEAVELARSLSDPSTGSGTDPSKGAPTLIGRDLRDALWPDRPTIALLDAAFPERPVVLFNLDLHSCWVNSAAVRRYGLPVTDGLLREHDCYRLAVALDDEAAAERDAWLAEAAPTASARGVVGIHDLEMGYNVDDWRARFAAGFTAFRVDSGVYWPDLERAAADGLRTGLELGPLHRVGSFKVITDGSLGTRNAYCVDPYPGTHDHGTLNVPPDELRTELRRAQEIGLEPAVHAIGDEANRLALDAMIELGTGGRIEHAQLLRDPDVARFAAGGITASVQPEHALDDRDIAERYWAGRTRRGYLIRSLLDAGARVRFGSDAPVAPLDPWQAISAAVIRTKDGREPWHPEQAVSSGEALACSVRSAVRPGEPADLVLLDADPLGDPERLRTMPVAATLVAGRVTHSTL